MTPDENLQIVPLFPLPVGAQSLNTPISKTEISYAMAANVKRNEGNITSVDTYVLENKSMERLRCELQNMLDVYFLEVFQPKTDVKLRITQSWFNYTSKGQYHHSHYHYNSLVSGVLYMQTEDTDTIDFINPHLHSMPIRISAEYFNAFNSASCWLPTPQNSVLLFPSNLHHNVPPVETDSTRISLAFNAYPVGTVGDRVDSTELIL